jgi:hypothetical protein
MKLGAEPRGLMGSGYAANSGDTEFFVIFGEYI